MPFPILLKLAGGALGLFLLSGKKGAAPVPAPTSMPIPERMAHVLATNDPNAIRFEAGRLRQEGHPTEAAQLEQAAKTLEAEIAAGKKPAPVYPTGAPPAAPTTGPFSQPPVGPLPAGAITSPGMPQPATHPAIPAGVLLPLPVLPAGTVLHYMPPPAPFDPRVQAWQTKLLSLGISVGPDGPDGKFGANTRSATVTFQQQANARAPGMGLPPINVNGMLDAPTLARAALVYPLPPGGKPTAPVPPLTVPVVVPAKPPVAAPMPIPMPMPAAPAMPVPTPIMAPAPVMLPQVPVPPVIPAVLAPVIANYPGAPAATPVQLPPPVPLPVLGKGQAVLPSQTPNANAKLVQGKLISLGFLNAADVPASQVGIYGPKTMAAVSAFQTAANNYLKASGQSMYLPNAGVTVSKAKLLTVDGKWGQQTNDMAAMAHPRNASGAYFGAFTPFGAPAMPMPASPLPGVVPPMAPAPIDARTAMASRVLHNLTITSPGHEDKSLVAAFQAQEGLRPSGYYQPSTAIALAKCGIVPPPPRYWPSTGRKKAKHAYARELKRFGAKDVQRREEWERAAASAAA